MILVRYIGSKERKTDNVAGTGTVWLGTGDVQPVEDKAWSRLSAYPEIWERVDGESSALADAAAKPAAPESAKAGPAKFVLEGPGGTVVLDDMDDDALKAFVAQHLAPAGVKIDGRKKGDPLRQAIVDAIKANGKEA